MTALRHDVAHLGHAELLTPEPERSLWFFVNILGLTETGREGNSVYLRTWDDYEQFSLKLTGHDTSGLGVTALRASSQEALERTVNYLAADVTETTDFIVSQLGARATEQIVLDTGVVSARWLHFASKSYDLVYTEDWTGSRGRLHHLAFATDTREDILRGADICLDHGVFIETGPHKHAIQQTFFLYVYEPGGNRIELCNPVARLIFAPDWETVSWSEAERAKGQAWGLKTISSFHTHGTPPVGP